VTSVVLLAALTMTGQELPLPARLALIVAAERIAVPVAVKPADLLVEPLQATIELHRIANAKALAQRMAAVAGQICPEVEAVGNAVLVRCRTKRLDAHLIVERGKTFLVVEQLRGLPWRDPRDRLNVFYDPETVGFGGPCPGTLPAGQGECALRDGRLEEASRLFKQAAASAPQASFAGVRLGDMALARGDVPAALGFYKRSAFGDVFGRLATARLCELEGNCPDSALLRVFNAEDRPEPVRSELLLRGARLAIFQDRIAEATHLLADAIADRTVGACTELAQVLCRRMLLVVLQRATGDEALLALESYLSLLDRNQGPLAVPMLHAAAEKAASIGAPAFGANLLAANATSAEGPGLGDHLLRTAELYLAASDLVRARVVVDYADTRAGRNGFGGSRWVAVRNQVRGAGEDSARATSSSFEMLATEGARDLASAYGVMARARAVKP
jgi:hypothetical protein